MGLFDSVSDFFSGGGAGDADAGYEEAMKYLRPYQEGGQKDYQNFRKYVGQEGDRLKPFNNVGEIQYNLANQSPTDYYNSIMSSYSESPQAKYEQEQALKYSLAGGAATGMAGSGAMLKALQDNAGRVSAADQQRYFSNVGNANQMQMGYIDDLRNRQNAYQGMQKYLSEMGYNSAKDMGGMAINRGLAEAQYDQNAFDSIAGLTGFGLQNYKNNSMSKNAANIPWYMMML